MRQITFYPDTFKDYVNWKETNEEIFDKINNLINDTLRDPFKGLGKPEPLKGNWKGFWSRRITGEHRLVYKVEQEYIIIVS
jgi:toxin YoeB